MKKEDTRLLTGNKNIINGNVVDVIPLLEVSRLPLSKNILNLYKKNTLNLIVDKELKYSSLRFENKDGKSYINATPFAKVKATTYGDEYKIDLNNFYALLLGGLTKLHFNNVLSYSRDCMVDCIDVYLELIGKVVLAGNHLSSSNQRNKLDFLLCYFVLSNNNIKAISNNMGYSKKISDILERDLDILLVKYPKIQNNEKLESEEFWKILQNEFVFLKDISYDTFIMKLVYSYGPANVDVFEDLSTIATLIVDFVQGNRATLNIAKNNFLKDVIKSKMYNNIVTLLIQKLN